MLNQFSRTELLIGKEGIEKLQNSKGEVYECMGSKITPVADSILT